MHRAKDPDQTHPSKNAAQGRRCSSREADGQEVEEEPEEVQFAEAQVRRGKGHVARKDDGALPRPAREEPQLLAENGDGRHEGTLNSFRLQKMNRETK
jgi:hypothetical protein